MGYYLGLDFGGTKLAAGIADEQGTLITLGRHPTDPAAGPVGALATLRRLVEGFSPRPERFEAVGISFGGPVDPTGTRTLLSHHGPGWEDYPLVEQVAEIWPGPVVMDNDANAAALGEVRFGAGRGYRTVLYVTVSTGIGGGIVIDGSIYRGRHGLAGEIGHTIVLPDGPPCPCGKRGCLEAVGAGPTIARAYAEKAGRRAEEVTTSEVFARARAGDPAAATVLEQAIRLLGIGLANAINLLDPDLVIVGGGVSKAGEALFQPLGEAVRAASAPSPAEAVRIVPAALGDAVGVLGAVALVVPAHPER